MDVKYSYPVQYIRAVQLRDETLVQLRPIHPSDGDSAADFKKRLSKKSIYDRFLGYNPAISSKLIKRLTEIDYEKEMAIVAEVSTEKGKEIIAVARIAPENAENVEFAIIIADEWQGRGLGSILTDEMIEVAKDLGFEKIYALVFTKNKGMLNLLKKRNFIFREEDNLTTCSELIL